MFKKGEISAQGKGRITNKAFKMKNNKQKREIESKYSEFCEKSQHNDEYQCAKCFALISIPHLTLTIAPYDRYSYYFHFIEEHSEA